MELVGITNTDFAEELFEQWRQDPATVPTEWAEYFRRVEAGKDLDASVTELAEAAAASAAAAGVGGCGESGLTPTGAASAGSGANGAQPGSSSKGSTGFIGHAPGSRMELSADKQSRVDALLWAFRDVGAIYADLNPLGGYETPEMRYMRITVEGAFESLSLRGVRSERG
jgi:2-oxoglutarate dehydrogenase complex dehydrogenase (E1) component-like enzyme